MLLTLFRSLRHRGPARTSAWHSGWPAAPQTSHYGKP
jgi:hypothetical protein